MADLSAGVVRSRTKYPIHGYRTDFAVENPIREGGIWSNGLAEGVDWLDIQTEAGKAYGGVNFATSHYDDATSVADGIPWSPNQMFEARIRFSNPQTGSNFEEVEGRLRTTISAHSITGYEFNWRCSHDGSQYHQHGYWYGPIGHPDLGSGACTSGCAFDAVPNSTGSGGNGLDNSFDVYDTAAATLAWGTTKYGGIYDGDTIGASIVGNLITSWVWHNGVKVILERYRDTGGAGGGAKFTSGSPGIGHWHHSSGGSPSDFYLVNWRGQNL